MSFVNGFDKKYIKDFHPVKDIVDKIIKSPYYRDFEIVESPEVVNEYATFDLSFFPKDHVARRPSDSFFIEKNGDTKKSLLLRPHTTVVWYYYLIEQWGKEKLYQTWEVKVLSYWKVYRVDNLDKTHHQVFHQIDGFKIVEKSKEIITQDTLKEVLTQTIQAIFGSDVKIRFSEDNFPYTVESLEAEVFYNWEWLEVLGAGIINPEVFKMLWIDPEKYNWWAFWFGIERLAMLLKWVPDIRIFWSNDPRITKQWWEKDKKFEEVSKYPPVYKDVSFIVPKDRFIKDEEETKKKWTIQVKDEHHFWEISNVIRDAMWEKQDLVEEVIITDIYENDKKFWENRKSVTIKIKFRSFERTLTNEEINKVYFKIRDMIESRLWYELR